LAISRNYAYQLLRNDEIPSIKLDRLRRVRKADVDAFIESKLAAK
jgi:excisionase family DNA binding protein